MNTTDEGLNTINTYIQDFKGKNTCNNCGKKLGLLNKHTIYERFGLKKWLCNDCFKQYKTKIKNNH